MSNVDRINESDSPSLSIGEFRTGTGRARQTEVANQKYALGEHPVRVRGTPESNPLYDAFESNIITTPRHNEKDTFRPITPPPPVASSHYIQNIHDDIDSTYDKPRSYGLDTQQKQYTNEKRQRSQNKVDSSPTSEGDSLMEKLGGDSTNPNDDLEAGIERKRNRRRRILYNLFDFLAIVATMAIFALIYVFMPPVKRGFFCDDTSIQYPFKPDTVPMWLLTIYGGLVPIIIFCIVEFWVVRPFHCRRGPGGNALKQRQVDYVKLVFHTIFLFILGIAVCFLITEVGKRTIGRLRPYYLTACNPIWSNLQCTKTVNTASGSVVIPQYILDHHCNSSLSEVDLREAKLSFPSGHSSYSTYAFIFLFVYFEARLVCPNIQFLKPFLQCLCVATAFFTCLSRVTDHKHHPTDVIGGALIGFCIAVFTAVRVGTYLWKLSIYCETDEETKKDRLPQEERIKIPGLETKQSGAIRSNEQNPDETLSSTQGTARPRNSNRSNYDNIVSMQASQQQQPPQQHRAVSNLIKTGGGQRPSPSRGEYEEANV